MFSALNLAVKVGLKFAEKGKFSNHDDVQNDSRRPDVGRLPIVGRLTHNIWVHIVGRSAVHTKLLVVTGHE